MQDDTSTKEAEKGMKAQSTSKEEQKGDTSSEPSQVSHKYFEVESELLSKPNAMCDIILAQGLPPTVVFCSSPSEADMVEVMLSKRGLTAQKVIGNLPYSRVAQIAQEVLDGTKSALVITDVAANDLEVNNFGLVIN